MFLDDEILKVYILISRNVCRIFKNSSLVLKTDSICFKKPRQPSSPPCGWLHYAAIGRQFSTKLSPLGSDRPGDTLWLINVYLYITIDDYDDDDDDNDGHGAKRPHNQTGRQCSECMPDPTAAFPSLFGSGVEIIGPDTLCPVSVSQQPLSLRVLASMSRVGWSVGLNVDVGWFGLAWPSLAWRSGFPDAAVAGCHFGAPHHWSFRCAAAALGKASH